MKLGHHKNSREKLDNALDRVIHTFSDTLFLSALHIINM